MSAAPAQFPTATILAYPRIGRERQLKRALEARWAGRITDAELTQAADELRRENLARLVELGLGATDASLADAPSLYDHVLDATILLGAIPPRFAGREGLDLYFARHPPALRGRHSHPSIRECPRMGIRDASRRGWAGHLPRAGQGGPGHPRF